MSHPEDPGSAPLGAPPSAARRIAVVGLPNTGKSQLYNELTGRYTLVANYPLTTVEPKSGPMSYRGRKYTIIDTPGLHSAYIHSEEEVAVRELLFTDPPDGLIQCIDANRLKQSLLLTLDLLALGLPLVLCLTAMDETERRGLRIDARRLAAPPGRGGGGAQRRRGQGGRGPHAPGGLEARLRGGGGKGPGPHPGRPAGDGALPAPESAVAAGRGPPGRRGAAGRGRRDRRARGARSPACPGRTVAAGAACSGASGRSWRKAS